MSDTPYAPEGAQSANPMAQTEPVEQRFAPAPQQQLPTGVDYVENGTVPAADVEEALKDVIDPELGYDADICCMPTDRRDRTAGADGAADVHGSGDGQLGVDARLGARTHYP